MIKNSAQCIAIKENLTRRYLFSIALLITAFFFIVLSLFCIRPVIAQVADFPEPLQPANNATDVGISNITFSWTPYYAGTLSYSFQIATDTAFEESDIVFKTEVPGTTYVYQATTLSYDTTYWWRVMASKPLGGTWSPVNRFVTKSAPVAPASTQPEEPDSFLSSVKGFFAEADPLLIGLIVAGIIVIVLAIYVVFLQPASKKKVPPPPPPPGGATAQQGLRCQQCGTPNTPGRKFCSNCGANLAPAPPPPTPPPPPVWAVQQQQTQQQQSASGGVCPSCGTPNPPGRKFCGNCGANLAVVIEPPPQQPQDRFCTSCGSSNPPGKKFCGNCGASLEGGGPMTQQQFQIGQTYTCPICGGPIAPGTNPCASCGTWLDWS